MSIPYMVRVKELLNIVYLKLLDIGIFYCVLLYSVYQILLIQVHVRAGIYHGGDLLCSIVSSQIGASPTASIWNEIMEFAMPMCDIPRSARLCFIIFGK